MSKSNKQQQKTTNNSNQKKQEKGEETPTQQYDRRNVGIQTVTDPKSYVSPQILSHHQLEQYDYNKFFYTPKTISTMIFALLLINYLSYNVVPLMDAASINETQPKEGFKYTSKIGILAAIIGFLAYSSTQYPDTLIKRPHPVFWRVILGLMSIYSLFMIYLLFQPLKEARKIFQFFDSNLGVPLPEKSYADDCRVYTPENTRSTIANVYDAVVDVHFAAHLFGWWFKMMIIRDIKVCWIISIIFELLEVTFRHWLPNFWECWWDHLLLDTFGCNMVGIILGAYTCRYMAVGRLHWIYTKPENWGPNPEHSKIKVLIEKFKPNVWQNYNWGVFSNFRNYCAVVFYCFFILAIDCNNFFLKFILWVPPDHKILSVRVAIWAFSGIAATKEFYEFFYNKYCKRVGPFIWLASFTMCIELSIAIKFGATMFHKPFPWYVQLMWVVLGTLIIFGGVLAIVNGRKQKKQTQQEIEEGEFQFFNPSIEIEPVYSKKNQ